MTTSRPSPARSDRGPASRTDGVMRRASRLSAAVALLLTLGIVVLGCGPEQQTGTETPSPTALHSGIRGIVLLGPVCPTASAEESPCLTPYAASLVITDSDGNVVTRI